MNADNNNLDNNNSDNNNLNADMSAVDISAFSPSSILEKEKADPFADLGDAPITSKKDIKIAVVGIGGAGNNALSHLLSREDLKSVINVEYYMVNTDYQPLQTAQNRLKNNKSVKYLLLGEKLTKGMGAGGDPVVGRRATLEDKKVLIEIFKNFDLVFLTCGLGGGTGSGAICVFAQILQSLNIPTVGVVNTPFEAEGHIKNKITTFCINYLTSSLDTLIVVPNDKIKECMGNDKDLKLVSAFKMANEILAEGVASIITIIKEVGFINVDFNDIKKIINKRGKGLIASAIASGDLRSHDAFYSALHNPLISDTDWNSISGVLINISVKHMDNILLSEWQGVQDIAKKYINENSLVIFGVSAHPKLDEDQMKITIILTGLDQPIHPSNIIDTEVMADEFKTNDRIRPTSNSTSNNASEPSSVNLFKSKFKK